MEILCENEARRLFLYHLAQCYFHEKAEELTIIPSFSPQNVKVHLKPGEKISCGTAPVDLTLHRERERAERAALGLSFARAAFGLTQYRPPYGTLVGVRPVKVPLFYLEHNMSEDNVLSLLQTEFCVWEKKAKLLVDLAKTELEFATSLTRDDAMLYVSIPFCPSRCTYCSFVFPAVPSHLGMIPEYLELLKEELRLTAELVREKGKRIRAVYIGGGTPGILSAEELKSLLLHIKAEFDLSHCLEFCVEIGRPDTVTAEKLDELRDAGVNRISINPQTTCDQTLEKIGRRHSAKDFFDAMALAKEYPFFINCDLISALPGETPDVFLNSVSEVLSTEPDNVTIHALCQKKSAEDQTLLHASEDFSDAVEKAHALCINAGLTPYYLYRQKRSSSDLENLGFAKKESFGFYNLAMMEDLCDIFACGAGAISKLVPQNKNGKIRRFAGFKYPFEYKNNPEKVREKIDQLRHEIQ